jgi:hypothetical protein
MGSGLSTRATIVGIIVALAFLAVVIELIRRHRIQERYSVLWVTTGVAMLLASAFNGLVTSVAQFLGVFDPRIALLTLVVFLLLVIALHFTTVISRLSEQTVRLTQEVAILRAEIDQIGQEAGSPPGARSIPPNPRAPDTARSS